MMFALVVSLATAQQCNNYYASVDLSLTGRALKSALHELIDNHKIISYSGAYTALEELDEHPTDSSSIIGLYTRRANKKSNRVSSSPSGWNREHTWPKSYGISKSGADYSDLHHLRASDADVNSARGNKVFADCTKDNSCTKVPAHSEAPETKASSSSFLPPPEVRGDIARGLLYMEVRYDGNEASTSNLLLAACPELYDSDRGVHGDIDDLLQWHVDDPVDDAERHRNDLVCEKYQGNRNPFIDHPELVDQLFNAPDVVDQRCEECQAAGSTEPCAEVVTNTKTTTPNEGKKTHVEEEPEQEEDAVAPPTNMGSSGTLLITEVADPSNSHNARFVEIYSPDGASLEGVKIARFVNEKDYYTYSIALGSKYLGAGEFLIVCKSRSAFQSTFGVACDIEGGSAVDGNGDDNYALVNEEGYYYYTVLDIFGVPGEDGTKTAHDFKDGRAVRKTKTASDVWIAQDWTVTTGNANAPSDFDPRQWSASFSYI